MFFFAIQNLVDIQSADFGDIALCSKEQSRLVVNIILCTY